LNVRQVHSVFADCDYVREENKEVVERCVMSIYLALHSKEALAALRRT